MTATKSNWVVIAGVAGLAGLGILILGKSKNKRPGDAFRATISFRHSGPGGPFWIGFAIAPRLTSYLGGPAILGHNNLIRWFYDVFPIKEHRQLTLVEYNVQAKWPDVPPGIYDALAFIQVVDGSLDDTGQGYVKAMWRDDVLIGV